MLFILAQKNEMVLILFALGGRKVVLCCRGFSGDDVISGLNWKDVIASITCSKAENSLTLVKSCDEIKNVVEKFGNRHELQIHVSPELFWKASYDCVVWCMHFL